MHLPKWTARRKRQGVRISLANRAGYLGVCSVIGLVGWTPLVYGCRGRIRWSFATETAITSSIDRRWLTFGSMETFAYAICRDL